ncbi:MAG: segregation/condensation protein A [Methylotenera sp.]|nr:segregation/condensation protein A [Oligoflexia bacterium]
MPITIRLESFEGPLDLLLYLIQSHELDISRISIGRITDQYLAYVRLMQELNFDIASEFLVMAATMLHWKSKSLLPQEPKVDALGNVIQDAEMSQEDLIRQLLEHQRFRQAGEDLTQLPRLGEDVFVRPNRKAPIDKIWKEMQITDLALSYQDMLTRARKRTQILRKETVSITDKIMDFASRLELGKMTEMRSLMSAVASKPEIVATFLASLELGRLKKMRLYQEEVYQAIYVELLESIQQFDLQMASGFDDVAQKVQDSVAAAHASGDTHNHVLSHAEREEFDLAGFTGEPAAGDSDSTGEAPHLNGIPASELGSDGDSIPEHVHGS